MKHLHAGNQSQNRFNLLLRLTSIRSEAIQGALEDHLVKGHQLEAASAFNDVPVSNVMRAVDKLEEVAGIVEDIKAEDWDRFRKNNL